MAPGIHARHDAGGITVTNARAGRSAAIHQGAIIAPPGGLVSDPGTLHDLKGILASRAAFYKKADPKLNTSAQALQPTFVALADMVRSALAETALPETLID